MKKLMAVLFLLTLVNTSFATNKNFEVKRMSDIDCLIFPANPACKAL